MKLSSLLPKGNSKSLETVISRLDSGPGNRETWHDLLQHVSRPGSEPRLPEELVGRVEQELDAEICLTKGEILLACGHTARAKQFLRAAPGLATTRHQLAEITSRAASRDSDFNELISNGDQARDARKWAEGARCYNDALLLYPTHFGYMVQHAHCLKEQEKFAEAEIGYRSALALGATVNDVYEHLDFAAAQQGYRDLLGGLPGTAQAEDTGTMMDAPPTKDDIDLVFTLLTGRGAANSAEVLQLLRTQRTIRDVFVWVIRQQRFRARNRELLRLIADGSLGLNPEPRR